MKNRKQRLSSLARTHAVRSPWTVLFPSRCLERSWESTGLFLGAFCKLQFSAKKWCEFSEEQGKAE